MAWPYAVYTDPAFAASILQAAAASTAGGLPGIAAVAAAAYPYAQLPAPYYQHPNIPRYTPYPIPGHGFTSGDIEPSTLSSFSQRASPSQLCHPSPTHSDTSIATLSPDRIDNSPENCDGSSSCRCGIINCVTNLSAMHRTSQVEPLSSTTSLYSSSGTTLPLLMAAAGKNSELGSSELQMMHSSLKSEQPKKLFQPYKTDLSETS